MASVSPKRQRVRAYGHHDAVRKLQPSQHRNTLRLQDALRCIANGDLSSPKAKIDKDEFLDFICSFPRLYRVGGVIRVRLDPWIKDHEDLIEAWLPDINKLQPGFFRSREEDERDGVQLAAVGTWVTREERGLPEHYVPEGPPRKKRKIRFDTETDDERLRQTRESPRRRQREPHPAEEPPRRRRRETRNSQVESHPAVEQTVENADGKELIGSPMDPAISAKFPKFAGLSVERAFLKIASDAAGNFDIIRRWLIDEGAKLNIEDPFYKLFPSLAAEIPMLEDQVAIAEMCANVAVARARKDQEERRRLKQERRELEEKNKGVENEKRKVEDMVRILDERLDKRLADNKTLEEDRWKLDEERRKLNEEKRKLDEEKRKLDDEKMVLNEEKGKLDEQKRVLDGDKRKLDEDKRDLQDKKQEVGNFICLTMKSLKEMGASDINVESWSKVGIQISAPQGSAQSLGEGLAQLDQAHGPGDPDVDGGDQVDDTGQHGNEGTGPADVSGSNNPENDNRSNNSERSDNSKGVVGTREDADGMRLSSEGRGSSSKPSPKPSPDPSSPGQRPTSDSSSLSSISDPTPPTPLVRQFSVEEEVVQDEIEALGSLDEESWDEEGTNGSTPEAPTDSKDSPRQIGDRKRKRSQKTVKFSLGHESDDYYD